MSENITEVTTKKDAEAVANKLNSLINNHETLKNAYFWDAPKYAHQRAWYGANRSSELSFKFWDHIYDLKCDLSCSSKNVYYKGKFYIDDIKTTVRTLKKALQKLQGFIDLTD